MIVLGIGGLDPDALSPAARALFDPLAFFPSTDPLAWPELNGWMLAVVGLVLLPIPVTAGGTSHIPDAARNDVRLRSPAAASRIRAGTGRQMISFEDVSVTYPDAIAPVLRQVDLQIAEGDLCLVIGATGSGKSTLLGAINGLVPHFTGGTLSGRVLVDGRDTARHRPRDLADVVGYVGQDPVRGFVTEVVEDEIAYGMEQLGVAPVAMRKRVEETLDLMGIADLRSRPLIELSGGPAAAGGHRVGAGCPPAGARAGRAHLSPRPHSCPGRAGGHHRSRPRGVGLTVVLAEHRLERVMHAADTIAWITPAGGVEYGAPADVLARSAITPPLAGLARALGWAGVPAECARGPPQGAGRGRPSARCCRPAAERRGAGAGGVRDRGALRRRGRGQRRRRRAASRRGDHAAGTQRLRQVLAVVGPAGGP